MKAQQIASLGTRNVFSAVIESRSGGDAHRVAIKTAKDGATMYATCTCKASQFGFKKAGSCWAAKRIAASFGITN